jgi:uncharacterized cupin superfamily protein
MSEANANSPHPLLKAETIAGMDEQVYRHPLNDKGRRHSRSLGDAVGMRRLGVHLARIRPGDDTTEYHIHHFEEEFIFILSGRGVAEIGGETFEVGVGDFIGFPARGPAHTMSNPFDDDLIYLVGGNRDDFDVTDYPRIRQRLFKYDKRRDYVAWDDVGEGSPKVR